MTLNRVVSTLVLTGLLSGASMAAQAQTRFAIRIATPAATVVAGYAPQYQGPGLVWISGYFDRGRWIPGYWAHRMDSRYRRQDHYSGRYARLDPYGSYMRGNDFGRNFRSDRKDHQWNRNRRDYRNHGRYNHRGRYDGNGHHQWNGRGGRH